MSDNLPQSSDTQQDETPEQTQPSEKPISTDETQPEKTSYVAQKECTDEELAKFRNIALNFIKNNRNSIAQIYINHFKEDGLGIILIDIIEIETTQKIDVSFVKFEALPIDLAKKIGERAEKNSNDIMYMYMMTPCEEKIVEMDIRDLITNN
jgi:hypothetical protein